MTNPTVSQQRGLAYAPIPFAVASILTSSYVIHHILFKEPKKRRRLYQRLVLAMNFVLVPFSITYVWNSWAVPKGTPYYVGAAGTVATCTARGFINLMTEVAIPIYYASLSLQAYLGIRNNFNEEKYRWIEKWIHAVAIGASIAMATVVAVTQNINPAGGSCWIAKSPRGCEGDPDVPCERGKDIKVPIYIFGVGKACVYFVLPPIVTVSMYFWLKKVQDREMKTSARMAQIRDTARKRMMHCAYQQISVYLFSFWFTWAPGLIWFVYRTISNNMAYNFLIFVNCVMASQGSVFTMAYFVLQRLGWSQEKRTKRMTLRNTGNRSGHELTVSVIRLNVEKPTSQAEIVADDGKSTGEPTGFNIFDGIPDPDSPWAMFIDCDDSFNGQIDEFEEQALPSSDKSCNDQIDEFEEQGLPNRFNDGRNLSSE